MFTKFGLTKFGVRRFGQLATLAVAVTALGIVTVTPAQAGSEPYIGWDFGNGFGIGIGAPPSAYDPCPTYGWPVYPHPCRYLPR
jgi:hypothetical protein